MTPTSRFTCGAFSLCLCVSVAALSPAADIDEFRVKREQVFEFAQRPQVTRRGDRVEVRFETKGLCDVTVAVEEAGGKIVRHLACGVLGANAPAPFQSAPAHANARKQVVVWDGKDDFGAYVDDKDRITIRVSLGLNPRFERTLFWSPQKRVSVFPPLVAPAPEGVYVFEGMGADHLRLFDHQGNYVRTVYPFPAAKVERVAGLSWFAFPQDNARLPLKVGHYQSTLFQSGDNALGGVMRPSHPPAHGLSGRAGTAFAVRQGRVALAAYRVSRFNTDGTAGPAPLTGPRTRLTQEYGGGMNWRPAPHEVFPTSAALSPDAKTLYLAGYTWDKWPQDGWYDWWHCLGGVQTLPLDGADSPSVFVGNLAEKGHGTDNQHFRCALSVAVDDRGRVYVCDYWNDRIQVYAPDAKFLKTIPVSKPVQAVIHQRTGEIYVFSWPLGNQFVEDREMTIPASLTRIKSFDDPVRVDAVPLEGYGGRAARGGHLIRAALDTWTDPPTIWITGGVPRAPEMGGGFAKENAGWERAGLRLHAVQDGRLRVVKDFGKEAKDAVVRVAPPCFFRQRLYVNPATGRLYLAEDLGFSKSFKDVVEIDPESGRTRQVDLPFDAEDLAFDLKGLAYLRTLSLLVRYDPNGWKEVPFDYGEERKSVGTSWSGDGRRTWATAGIPLHSATLWHHGGMSVSAGGHIVVACTASGDIEDRAASSGGGGFAYRGGEDALKEGKPYKPVLYPGRVIPNKGAIIHIWDEHGRTIREDVVPGLSNCDGTYIDKDDSVYVMSAQRRVLDGKPYFNTKTGTLMKFRPGTGRILSASDRARIPLAEGDKPKRPPDLTDPAWAVNAEWLYGGVDFAPTHDNICACSNARFTLDYFARSFAPELRHYTVAVLDANGNLILRVGRYGNVDDGVPLVSDQRSAVSSQPEGRRLGGDEVALFYAPYVASHTDHRLFIADPGNARVVSVKLDYHTNERVALVDVKDRS